MDQAIKNALELFAQIVNSPLEALLARGEVPVPPAKNNTLTIALYQPCGENLDWLQR